MKKLSDGDKKTASTEIAAITDAPGASSHSDTLDTRSAPKENATTLSCVDELSNDATANHKKTIGRWGRTVLSLVQKPIWFLVIYICHWTRDPMRHFMRLLQKKDLLSGCLCSLAAGKAVEIANEWAVSTWKLRERGPGGCPALVVC